MIVLCDTSPLNYLILIGYPEILAVILPTAVAKLRQTNFHISEQILIRALADAERRKRQ